MDLGAFAQIEDLSTIVAKNGIYVPRLRGYRLMKDEESLTLREIKNAMNFKYDAEQVIRRHFLYKLAKEIRNIRLACLEGNSYWTAVKYVEKYVLPNGDFDFSKVHGKLRKRLKFAYKKCFRKTKKQYDIWNRYAGRADILYIHARIGGLNWKYFECEESVAKEPWFLEKVDDAFDSTYCDIYAKIDLEILTHENNNVSEG